MYSENMTNVNENWGILGNPPEYDFGTAEFRIVENRFPKFEVVDRAFCLFRQYFENIVSLRYYLKYWVVEIEGPFDTRHFPGKFSGLAVRYFSKQMSVHSHPRLLQSEPNISDNTAFGLIPGVKVCGQEMSSSGVLVHHPDGRRRLTLSNHGLRNTDQVYHPDVSPSFCLGVIRERYMFNDIALCDIHPSINFTNITYFTANPPTILMDAYTVEGNVNSESRFEVEGMATGRVFLLYSGPGSQLPSLSVSPPRRTCSIMN